mgnify:FL=1
MEPNAIQISIILGILMILSMKFLKGPMKILVGILCPVIFVLNINPFSTRNQETENAIIANSGIFSESKMNEIYGDVKTEDGKVKIKIDNQWVDATDIDGYANAIAGTDTDVKDLFSSIFSMNKISY